MKKSWNKLEIINQYKSGCDIMHRATLDGDYKTNNKEINYYKSRENE